MSYQEVAGQLLPLILWHDLILVFFFFFFSVTRLPEGGYPPFEIEIDNPKV